MKRTFLRMLAAAVLLITQSANAQLIGEGDTLWYKSLYPNTITQVQFSPDGTKLGVVVNDNRIIMYNAQSGDSLWSRIFNTRIYKFTVSKSGKTLWINNAKDTELVEMGWDDGNILNKYKYNSQISYYSMVFSTPNPKIFLISNQSTSFALFDIEKGNITKEITISEISKYAVSPKSNFFIRAFQYETNNQWKTKINLYDINTLEYISNLGEEEGLVETSGEAKISYDGKYAATNFGGRALQIWDLENKKLFKEYTPTIPTVSTDGSGGQATLAFCHDNEILINCGGYYLDAVKGFSTTITNFINDKRSLIIPNESAIYYIDVNKGDTYFAAAKGWNIMVFKLHKDLVPVKEYQEEPIQILYPNPTSGDITIDLKENQFVESVKINDIKGIEVLSIPKKNIIQTNTKITINLPNLDNGIYLLNLITNHGIMSYKLIMEK